jgi:hypothetical protein
MDNQSNKRDALKQYVIEAQGKGVSGVMVQVVDLIPLFDEIDRLNAELAKHQPQLATGLPKLKGTKARVYDFIAAHIQQHGYPPSMRDIANGIGTVPSTAFRHMEDLIKLGYISRGTPGAPRTLRIIGRPEP